MGDRPNPIELIGAVARFLEEELLPELEGVHRFHTRVAINALGIIGREIESEAETLPQRHARLATLLERTEPGADLRAEIDAMETELSARIRAGEADDDSAWRENLFEHLRRDVAERLAVSNPAHR